MRLRSLLTQPSGRSRYFNWGVLKHFAVKYRNSGGTDLTSLDLFGLWKLEIGFGGDDGGGGGGGRGEARRR